MRYREAKLLHNGDEVILKSDKTILLVKSLEVFGQYKKVKLNCVNDSGRAYSVYNDEIN